MRNIALPLQIIEHPLWDAFEKRAHLIKHLQYFIEWIESLRELTEGEVIAIDGKRRRGCYDKEAGKSAIHMISAYGTAQRLLA